MAGPVAEPGAPGVPERAGDVKHSSACVDKLKSTGFKPEFNFDQGLEIAVKAYRDALQQEEK